MPLPKLNENGELPVGLHKSSLQDVVTQFGTGSFERESCTEKLRVIYDLAVKTNFLDRLIVFGSYLTDKLSPNDVDVILIMRNGFEPEHASVECRVLFDHVRAQEELGASLFWVTAANIIAMTVDEFINGWQATRDNTFRGIVEITHD